VVAMNTAMCNATIISPPQQIQLDGGEEDKNNKWTGGYWVFTAVVDQFDSLVGKVVLPSNTSIKQGEKEIRTKKTVEIYIKPLKAYYRRLLKLAPIEDRFVAPKVYKGGMNKILGIGWWDTSVSIGPTVVEYYTWAEPTWQKYTTFEVSVYVEGKLCGQTTFNTEEGTKDLVVKTDKGSVLIKNLGRLEGDYTEPQVPTDIIIFDEKYVFTGEAKKYIRYDHGREIKYWGSENSYLMYIENSEAFSTYWWGTVRWNPKSVDEELAETPAPFLPPNWYGYDIIPDGKGWKACDTVWDFAREPVAPFIYPEEGPNSLIAYLNMKCSSGNIAETWLTGYNWHIQKKDDKPYALIVDIPWGAYSGAPLVTFYVPSELADTFVYRPPISDIRIEKVAWLNGSEIPAACIKKCEVTLKQYAKVTSSSTVIAEILTSRASVSPTSRTVTLEPNETQKITFQVSNNGVDFETEGAIVFIVKRTWDGMITSKANLNFKLLAPVLPSNTTEVIDRTGPVDPDSKNKADKSGYPWVLITAAFCGTAMVCVGVLIARDEYKRRKAVKLAKGAARGTKKMAKAVAEPVWERYKPQIATSLVGTFLLFFGLLWQRYSPFWIVPIKPSIFGTTVISTSLESVLCIFFGAIFLLIGVGSLLLRGVLMPARNTPAEVVVKTLLDYLKKEEKE